MESIRRGMKREGHFYVFISKLLALFLIFEPFYLYSGLYEGNSRFEETEVREVLDFLGGLLSPSSAGAAPPVVMVPPHAPTDPLVPHETYSGATTVLKGIAWDPDNNLVGGSYYWDFGDGEQSPITPITASTNLDNLSTTHVYNQLAGTLIVARLYVKDAADETSSKEYRVLIKEKTLDVEVNKAIDDALWYLYTVKGVTGAGAISSNSLRTPDGMPGLKGEYFNNSSSDYKFNFSGSPALVRIDPEINFDWGSGSPGPGVNSDYVSIRWTGEIFIPYADFYYFYTVSDDGVRLFIDEKMLINDPNLHGATWNRSPKIYLSAGWHSIRLEYFEAGGSARVGLYWGGYYWNNVKYGDHYGNTTGSAVQALQINGHLESGDALMNPYVTVVRGAMGYLLGNLSSINLSVQAGGDPDTNGNGIGLYWPSNRPIYETGAIMDGIVASGTPNAIARTGGLNVAGRTYKEIVQDMVDFYAWSQSDQANGGSWRYGLNDGERDNSAAQWAAIGMVAAERHFGCTVPQWVKDRNDAWLNLSFMGNRFGYTGTSCNDACWATTPSGMVQMAFDDRDVSDSRWVTTEKWLADNWASFLGWNRATNAQTRNNRYYSYYAFVKAMRLALPQERIFITKTNGTEIDWYGDPDNGLARLLVDTQKPDGSWPYDDWPYVGEQTAAAWCVIMLGRSLFEKPPVAVATASPNPAGVGTIITLDGSHSYHLDPAKKIVQYLWDFDASNGVDFDYPDATDPVVTTAYGGLQDYVVTLKVVDDSTPPRSSTTQITVHVTVPPHPPTAVAGGPYLAAVGEPVQVDGSGSYDIDEGMSQSGCEPPCPPDTVTAWDWESKMVAPYQFNDAHGKVAILPPFSAPGFYDIALRVTDNTALSFPASGQPNLTDVAYGRVYVFPGGIENLRVRPKETKCELLWTPYPGAESYDVLRSEKGPNEGFEFIGETTSTYCVFIDRSIQKGKDYWYKVMTYVDNQWIISGVVYTRPGGQGSVNRPPVITSQPITVAQSGELYSYQVEAVDPEGQPLTYLLDQAPTGMTIDPATGLITWTPGKDQLGMNDVTVRVQDPGKVSVSQSFSIFVRMKTNTPPVAVPGGPYFGELGQSITFNGSASSDPDGDKIVTYRWVFGDGSEATGAIVNHTYITGGTFTVKLYVTDERGGTGSASTVATVNRSPVSVPGAAYVGTVNVAVHFDGSRSYDLDGDPLSYSWDFGDGATGSGALVDHTYTAVGHYTVTLTVSDGKGGISSQSTLADIREEHINEAPIPSFTVSGNLIACGTVIFDASLSYDPDGTLASYVWSFGDGGATTGRWVSHVYGAPGDYTVTLTVTDDMGVSIPTTQNVSIGANNSPVAVPGGPYRGKPSTSIAFNGSGSTDPDGDAIVRYEWDFGDAGTAEGVAVTHTYSAVGTYTVRLMVTDACGKQGSTETTVQIVNDVTPPQVAILNPVDGSEITAPTDIVGTAKDANFDFYVLEYAASGSGTFVEFARGTSSVENAVLGRFDPTMLLNGLYTIRLTAFDQFGNLATTEVTYAVKGKMKIGNFTISFTDLSIPLGGINIQITRTYDSRDKGKGDFGIGWRMDLKTLEIQKSQPEGMNWDLVQSGFAYYLQEAGDHSVSIMLPNGDIQIFDFAPTPSSQLFVPLLATRSAYTPRTGTYLTLEPVGDRDLLVGGDGILYDYEGRPYDPQTYKLTAPTGVSLIVDIREGVKKVTDESGNVLTIGPSGIFHSSGTSISFVRDGENRIVSIVDPMNYSTAYVYDGNGDLVSFFDQEGNQTTFIYDDKHFLLEIRDPLGRPYVKNLYDAQGRLIGQVDAQGNEVNFVHDITGRQEVVFDKRGFATIYTYDEQGRITAVTNPLGATANYTYDDRGNMLTATNTSGETTTFGYDDKGNLTEITDPKGIKIALSYDSNGRLTSIGNSGGESDTYVYDEKGRLIKSIDRLGNARTNIFDDRGNLKKIVDPTGREATFEYDSYGRTTRRMNFDGKIQTFAYDGNGNVTSMSIQNGTAVQSFSMSYNGRRQLTQVTTPSGTIQVEYDQTGRITSEIAPWGRTVYEYGSNGRMTKVTYPDGTEESFVYGLDGLMLSRTDRMGRTTSYEYDNDRRVTKTIFPDGSSEIIHRNSSGRETGRTARNGKTTTYEYDEAGRVNKVTDPAGNTSLFVYDGNGNLMTYKSPSGAETSYTYNKNHQRTKTEFPDGTTFLVDYNAFGQSVAETDQNGFTSLYEYGGYGTLTKVTDPLGGTAIYGYDTDGNLTLQIDPAGRKTELEYEPPRKLTKRTLPLGQRETYEYDTRNFLVKKNDFNGNAITFTRDVNGNVIEKTYPDGSKVKYTYLPSGKMGSMIDSRGTTQFQYDSTDRLVKVIHPNGQEVVHTYDSAGNLTSLTVLGKTTSYEYDDLNRLVLVTDSEGRETRYSYLWNSRNPSQILYADGSTASFVYDAMGRLTKMETKDKHGNVISSYQYTLGKAGERLRVEEHTGRVVEYSYDALYRLTKEKIQDPIYGNKEISYTYDGAGNRLTKTEGSITVTYTYDNNNRLLSDGLTTYVYDNNGNLINRTTAGQTDQFEYDYENRLIAYTPHGGSRIVYTYDGLGNLVNVNTGSSVIHYLVDITNMTGYPQVLAELDGSNNVTASYVYGVSLLSMNRSGAIKLFHTDGRNSVRLLTDADGNVTDTYDFDAFGSLLSSTGSTENPYLFDGERWDANIGAYYLRARYYLPVLGRFLTMDTMLGLPKQPQSLNLYTYAENDPVNKLDRSGKQTLVDTMVANSIRNTLANVQMDFGWQAIGIADGVRMGHSWEQIYHNWVWGEVMGIGFAVAPMMIEVLAKSISALRDWIVRKLRDIPVIGYIENIDLWFANLWGTRRHKKMVEMIADVTGHDKEKSAKWLFMTSREKFDDWIKRWVQEHNKAAAHHHAPWGNPLEHIVDDLETRVSRGRADLFANPRKTLADLSRDLESGKLVDEIFPRFQGKVSKEDIREYCRFTIGQLWDHLDMLQQENIFGRLANYDLDGLFSPGFMRNFGLVLYGYKWSTQGHLIQVAPPGE